MLFMILFFSAGSGSDKKIFDPDSLKGRIRIRYSAVERVEREKTEREKVKETLLPKFSDQTKQTE